MSLFNNLFLNSNEWVLIKFTFFDFISLLVIEFQESTFISIKDLKKEDLHQVSLKNLTEVRFLRLIYSSTASLLSCE